MSLIRKLKNKLFVKLNPWFREHVIIPRNKKALRNAKILLCFVIIVLGVIFHELGMKFLSPTVNLWMNPKDFIKYCSNLRHYSQCKLEFLNPSSYLLANIKPYPVARLDDIIIYFQHYATNQEARKNGKRGPNA